MVSVNRTLQEEEEKEEVEANGKQSLTTFHQAFLCSLNLGPTQQTRYSGTYNFLTSNLPIFNKQCSVDYLPPKLEDMIEYGKVPPDLSDVSFSTPKDRFLDFQEERALPSEFHKPDSKVFGDQKLPYPNVNEMCFQWYNPSFNSIIVAMEQHQTPIYLLCTATKKKEKLGELDCLFDYFLFPHDYITDIYKRIKKIIHLKEVAQKAVSPIQKAPPGTKRKSKGNIDISTCEISSDAESELQREIFLILDEIQTLLRPKAKKLVRAPFELNNPNLNQLLEMFDVSSGSSLITSDIASWILKLLFP